MPLPLAPVGATARRVNFSCVGEDWVKFLIDAEDPRRVLDWVAGNLTGPWSCRTPPRSEVRERFGYVPAEQRHFLVLAFQDETDAEAFALWRVVPQGRA